MEVKDVIFELRNKAGLSQEELAERLYVTRQAVSRWENGDTTPNIETLKLLSKLFGVSIDAVLGDLKPPICQCCGMTMRDGDLSREKDGSINERFCRQCYSDGSFTLDWWERYGSLGGMEGLEEFKRRLIEEFNALGIEGLPKVEQLNVVAGSVINLEYRLPNGNMVKLLSDKNTYLGNSLECEFGGERRFGIAAGMDFLMVSTYEGDGDAAELVIYKKR